jgi:hypothetical protein
MPVDDERGVGLVTAEKLIDCLSHWAEFRRIESALAEYRRIAGSQQQLVAFTQRHVEVLGKVQHHVGTRPRAAGLDKAEVARRDAGGKRELELTQPAMFSPVA